MPAILELKRDRTCQAWRKPADVTRFGAALDPLVQIRDRESRDPRYAAGDGDRTGMKKPTP
jgi:hypothetical protein